MTGKVVFFPIGKVDLDRVRLDRDEPCLVLILPVVRLERDDGTIGGGGRGQRRDVKGLLEENTPTDCN